MVALCSSYFATQINSAGKILKIGVFLRIHNYPVGGLKQISNPQVKEQKEMSNLS